MFQTTEPEKPDPTPRIKITADTIDEEENDTDEENKALNNNTNRFPMTSRQNSLHSDLGL